MKTMSTPFLAMLHCAHLPCRALLVPILVVVLIALPAESAQHNVPLFVSGTNSASGQQGLVRVVNHSDWGGTATVRAIDDTGATFGSDTISLASYQATHFDSDDLELGNASKGFRGVGSGAGDWRLQIESDLRLEVLAYVRTTDGPLVPIQGEARQPGVWHLVPTFNPASATRRASKLRLINPGEATASAAIVGVDDSGETYRAAATVDGRQVLTINAEQLESGTDLRDGNGLGNGAGKWRLHVAADRPISVMSLMETPTGYITNLSHSTSRSDWSLPEQITPPVASSGFYLVNGQSRYRIAYARGEFFIALVRGVGISSNLAHVLDASGRHRRVMYLIPHFASNSTHDLRDLTYGGQDVLYFSLNRGIVAYGLDGNSNDSRSIDIPWSPHEIDFGLGKLLVVTWVDDEAEVRQLTLDGEEVGTPFPLSTRNENPTGTTYWDGHLYVVDEEKEQVFVYSIASGQRNRALEFELDPDNDVPHGIEYANGMFYVPDAAANWVYAYTPSGETVEARSHLALGGQPVSFSP